MAISGDTLVVGATGEDSNAVGVNPGIAAEANNTANASGAVYVFTRSADLVDLSVVFRHNIDLNANEPVVLEDTVLVLGHHCQPERLIVFPLQLAAGNIPHPGLGAIVCHEVAARANKRPVQFHLLTHVGFGVVAVQDDHDWTCTRSSLLDRLPVAGRNARVGDLPRRDGRLDGVLRHLLVRVIDGELKTGDRITLMASGAEYEAEEVGYLTPKPVKSGVLRTGEVGYLIAGIKDVGEARSGETVTESSRPAAAPPGPSSIEPPWLHNPNSQIHPSASRVCNTHSENS